MIPSLQFISASRRWQGVTALNGLDLTVMPGQAVALIGRANAGKTTAIGLALGFCKPTGGAVRVFGLAPGGLQARRLTGVLPERAELPPTIRVHELIRLVRAYYPAPLSTEAAAEEAGITHLLGHRVGRLKPAQRRALQFALAICGRPRLLILDDPCSAMDSAGKAQLRAALRQAVRDGAAVLTTSRYTDDLEDMADRVCVLSAGSKVAETSVADLRAQHVVRRVLCRTATPLPTLCDLPEALLVQQQPDGRLSIETGTPERLVQRLSAIDPQLSDVQVLHATTPHVVRIV